MSTMTLPEMFSDTADPAEHGRRLTELNAALNQSHIDAASGLQTFDPITKTIQKGFASPAGAARVTEILDNVTKAAGAGALTAISAEDLGQLRALVQGNVQKNWTPTTPVTLAPYDLQAPAKLLVPHETPLRNSLPRERGVGSAGQYRAITSFTNDGLPNGVGQLTPFFNSQTSSVPFGGPGNVNLNRPPKIDYDGEAYSVAYVEQGYSDQVNWIAEFQSRGFDSARGLSHTALLWSTMLGEERAILFGRGTSGNGYSGVVAAPSGITTGTATTGGTIAAATYYVYVVAITGFGQSAASTVVSQVTTGATSTLTVNVGTEPTGALYYAAYIGTTTGIANAKYQGTFIGNTKTYTSYDAAGAVTAGTDTSADANAYDGYLTVQSDPARTGYFRRLNAALSTTNPGTEVNTALAAMWNANRARPSEAWMTGQAMTVMSEGMRTGGSASNGYVTNINVGNNGVVMGTAVVGAINPVTRTMISFHAHPFMPAGCILLRSTTLPIPNSNVPNPAAIRNVQEYMAIDWPVIQMSYDASTYLYGSMMHYAPAWSGLIVGVTNG